MFVICFAKCTPKPQTGDTIFVDLDRPEKVSLFDYFRSIELIPLETSPDAFIAGVSKMIVHQDSYYTLDKTQCIIFAPKNMKKRYKYILMDLDGTLTDPMEGITKSVQYALFHLGIKVDDLHSLCKFIGPPLRDSFVTYYSLSDEQADVALMKYRERFKDTGIFENMKYEGIDSLLEKLTDDNRVMLLASSKPTVYVERILEHFGLRKYFAFVGGSNLDGTRVHKDEVIRYVLSSAGVRDLAASVMVGDREFDITGAKKNGLDSIGVLYGYGSTGELIKAGATYLAKSVPELEYLLLEEFF